MNNRCSHQTLTKGKLVIGMTKCLDCGLEMGIGEK